MELLHPECPFFYFIIGIGNSVLFENHPTQRRHARWGIPRLALMVARVVYVYIVHYTAFCTRNVDGLRQRKKRYHIVLQQVGY